jgi:hypothetical protein
MTEKQEQASIVKLLRLIGAAVYVLGTTRKRTDFHGTMQTPGIPDVFCYLPRPKHGGEYQVWGYLPMWIEVKAAKGRLSPAQVRFRELTQAAGVRYYVGGADGLAVELRALGYLR